MTRSRYRPDSARGPVYRFVALMAVVLVLASGATTTVSGIPPRFNPFLTQDKTPDDPEAALALAQTASNAQNATDYETAAKLWEELIEKFPEASLIGKAHYNAGVCRIQPPRDYASAIEHFKTAIPKLQDDQTTQLPQARLYLGFAQYRLGQQLNLQNDQPDRATELLTTATQTLETLIKQHPEFEDIDQACFFQGGAFEDLARLEEAKDAYQKMLTFPKQTFQAEGLFALANVNEQLGQYTEAIKYYEQFRNQVDEIGGQALLDEVNFRTAKTLLAMALAQQNNQADAASATDEFRRAADIFAELAEKPTDGRDPAMVAMIDEAQYQQAYCLTQLGDFESAAATYRQVADRSDSNFRPQSLVYAGRCYAKINQPQKAIDALTESLTFESSPFAVEGARWLTSLYLAQGDLQKTFDTANEWINKSPDSSHAASMMMDRADALYRTEERKAESPPLYLEIADEFPQSELAPLAIYNAAFALLEIGQPQQAIAAADRFEASHPQHEFLPDTLEVKADALLVQDEPAKSAEVFDRLLQEFPQHEKASRWKVRTGLARFVQQQYQPAVDVMEPAVEQMTDAPLRAEALHWIGSSYFNLEQFDLATAKLEQSLQTDTNWGRADETLLTLARAAIKSDNLARGTAAAQRLVDDYPQSELVADAHFYLGEDAYQQQKYQDALTHFNTVLKQYPESRLVPYSLYNAAWCQTKLENYSDAENLFSTLIDQHASHELAQRAKMDRGATRRKSGKMEASIADLKAFLATDPKGQPRHDALWELGLTQVEEQLWQDAIKTFDQLISEDATSDRLDRYRYELAWAHQSTGQSDKALEQFAAIANNHPDSPLAAEANFHVGTSRYQQQQFDQAIEAYQKSVDSDADDSIREKAAYKLAWAHYKQEQFEQAAEAFNRQTELFPNGDLFADGIFMVAESQFRLKNHAEAFEAYTVAKPVVDSAENIDPKIPLLTMLHGAQSANKTQKYDQALELVKPLTESEKIDDSYQQDAWLELGTAMEGLGKVDEALQAWRNACKNDTNKTAARARCMIGDTFFRQKKFNEAIEEFKRVYYGFNGIGASSDIRPWQAYALYEAARCNFVQVNDAPEDEKPGLIEEAIKQFEYLVQHYGDDRLAPEATKQLETLKKLQTR